MQKIFCLISSKVRQIVNNIFFSWFESGIWIWGCKTKMKLTKIEIWTLKSHTIQFELWGFSTSSVSWFRHWCLGSRPSMEQSSSLWFVIFLHCLHLGFVRFCLISSWILPGVCLPALWWLTPTPHIEEIEEGRRGREGSTIHERRSLR